ncbi:hypothetical protein ES288_D03G185000v1 [Gossypium darwinii]|uniref:RING-type domain-containing protein n=1 Tax=Gossypium darwinii TaxID=34276 RepID=A0A5D2D652_GOSDA|nr:hypothetical protein ES288_D03G116300v1 [Gossypium darwinii]TYG77321.1 hypothetical protein ES288_D03G185000v1 [Gossypium darwinii]
MSFAKLLDLLHYLAKFISNLLHSLRLPGFSQPYIPWRDTLDTDTSTFAFALLIDEHLPVIKFSGLIDPPDNCPCCLCEFEGEDESRQLMNCRNIFHGRCLDCWMGYDQQTCPLCRTNLVPHDMEETFYEKLWGPSGVIEFFVDYHQSNAL